MTSIRQRKKFWEGTFYNAQWLHRFQITMSKRTNSSEHCIWKMVRLRSNKYWLKIVLFMRINLTLFLNTISWRQRRKRVKNWFGSHNFCALSQDLSWIRKSTVLKEGFHGFTMERLHLFNQKIISRLWKRFSKRSEGSIYQIFQLKRWRSELGAQQYTMSSFIGQ